MTERAPSVEDDIRAAMAELRAKDAPEPESAAEPAPASETEGDEPAPETAETKPARERGPDGKFKAKGAGADESNPAKAAETAEGAQEKTAEPATKGVEAPHHWSAQDKAAFAKAPAETQSWLLGRIKAIEGDATRKTQEAAQIRKEAQPILEIFEPYREQLALNGMTPAQVVQRWAAAEKFLQRDGKAAIKWLAGQYGVDLTELVGGAEPPAAVDPALAELRNKLSAIEQSVTGFTQSQRQAAEMARTQAIQKFASATDADGNLLHPHFDDVLDDMLLLARAETEAGRTPDLEALYERAVWASPAVRERLLEAQRTAAAQAAEKAAKEKAAKARAAGSSVRDGAAGPAEAIPPKPLRDELRERLRDARLN